MTDYPALKEKPDKIFRYICSYPQPPDMQTSIKNYKLRSARIHDYLKAIYSTKIAHKMLSNFDLNNSLDYRAFYKQLFDQIQAPSEDCA